MGEKEGGILDRWPVLTPRISIAILILVYLPLAVAFSLLTRTYEADDEPAHTQIIEYIVHHDALPHIAVANGLESHQPPLYYLLAAGWQDLLHIPAFTPIVVPAHYKVPFLPNRLAYSPNYTPTEHQDAVDVHELRLLSVALGLGTVLFTYSAARVAGMREWLALGAGLFVALLPRELVVTSVVTNDALVIPLCALAFLLYLLAERARSAERFGHRRLYVLAMGLTLGAAAATKFNSLPIAAVLFALSAIPCIRRSPRWAVHWTAVVDLVIAIAGFLAVSGWVFLRNDHLYGQFLATKSSETYLKIFLLHPVPWSSHMIFSVFPKSIYYSAWFSQPNFFLTTWMDTFLGAAALLTLAVGTWALLRGHDRVQVLPALAFLGCIAAAAAAVLVTVKTTSIGDARTAFVGIAPFAAVVVAGCSFLAGKTERRLTPIGILLWPVVLLGVDLYVLIRFLIPLGGL